VSTVPPKPARTYRADPYQPDGGVPLGGLLLTVVLSFISALLIGAVVSFFHQWFYLVLVFPAAMGAGVGAAGISAIRSGKLRSPLLGGLVGIAAGILVMLTSLYGDYLRVLWEVHTQAPELRALEQDFSFVEFMDMRADQGVAIGRVGRGNDKGMNLGYIGSYIYWGVEIALAAGIAFSMMRPPTRKPFCSGCQLWKKSEVLGGLHVGRETIKGIMDEGDLPQLFKPGLPTGFPVIFTALVCPECADRGTVEINLREVAINAKGEPQHTDLGTWSFAGDALVAWKSGFAVPDHGSPSPASPG
jgi:hypothetical protein